MINITRMGIFVVAAALIQHTGFAQGGPGTTNIPNNHTAPEIASAAVSSDNVDAGPEYVLSIAVLAFGVAVFAFVILVMLKRQPKWDDASFKAFTLPLVVFSGLFLITAGYDQHQVAPMFGLLGTLIGYILGHQSSPGHADTNHSDNAE